MAELIAVVDDEPDILHLVTLHLKKASFEVLGFLDANSFLNSLKGRTPDLIILDLMLPDKNGLDVCRHLRSDNNFSNIPIIMLTAKGLESDKVLGLELGADDYVTKPFSPKELVARVKAVLRRSSLAGEITITIGDRLVIDPEKYEVKIDGTPVELTAVEFKILYLLASNIRKVFTREIILDHLWGNEKAVLDRTVDVHIKNLRDKLGPAKAFIKNIRGVGYKLEV